MKTSEIIRAIRRGKVFIYPTDKVYGLGYDATNQKAVERIKNMKGRDKDKPLSVIAPSIDWIEENLIADCELKKYLPGPYTLILKKRNLAFLSHASSSLTIGVRIPVNKFTREIQKANVPFITTSVNLSGEPFALTLEDIPQSIKGKVDIIIPADEKLSGKPTILIIDGKIAERK